MSHKPIVAEYARMWPREVFDIFDEGSLAIKQLPELASPGVYILYRDEAPHYIGKSKKSLFSRLHNHSNHVTDPYFHFWNYFSFFVVPDASHVDEVEGILIASMPTSNSAMPKIPQIKLPRAIARVLRRVRRRAVNLDGDTRS